MPREEYIRNSVKLIIFVFFSLNSNPKGIKLYFGQLLTFICQWDKSKYEGISLFWTDIISLSTNRLFIQVIAPQRYIMGLVPDHHNVPNITV